MIESLEIMPSQVDDELQGINETISDPLGLNEANNNAVTISSTLPTLTEIAKGLDDTKRVVIDFGGAKISSAIELPLKILGTSLGLI